MASAAAAIDLAATPKSVDESLWWDSFVLLLNDLENAPLSLELPLSLVKKLKNNHSWFLDTVSLFKPPNQTSRAALDSHKVDVGSHRLIIQPQLKDVALHVSSCLCLDEVQSYILVKQSVERDNMAADLKNQEFVHWILLQYYIERQCLLKCTRQILMHALYIGNVSKDGNAVQEEALKLFADGLERKLLSVLQNLLSSKYPEHMEIDLATLWAEETLIEDSLVLDILFLAYYESFCACNGEQWKNLCLLYKGVLSGSFNFAMLTLSIEARNSLYHAKVQLLLILIETLDLESLLQMVHDEVPFRQGHSVFSLKDVQVMDSVISSFNVLETGEASPLILAWAVFLCLISSLPEKQDNNVLMEIDHAGYVRQAFEAAPLNYFLEILENDILKDSDAVCFSLLDIGNSSPVQAARTSGHIEESLRVDVVEIICTLVKNLSPDGSGAKLMALSITIMANMLKCSPSHVAVVALKSNILDVALRINSFEENSNVSSGRWCLSGGLARMLLIDCEQNEECCQLTISVLDFTMRLLETGAQDDAVLALVVFCLQYVFVNHEYWKYKLKHFRWKVTIKVLEVMKKCITSIPHLQKLGHVIRNILLSDSSIHNTLFRIMCITTHTVERLYIIRLYELKEIEGLQLAVCSVLDIVSTMLNDLSKDISFSLPVFHQAILSSVTKPIPVVKAVISLISFFRDQAIQVGAARVLSMLCTIADNAQPYLFGNICLASDDMQIMDLRYSISDILCEGTPRNEDLFVAILKLLTSAATFQPAFLVSVIATKENMEDQLSLSGDLKRQAKEASFGSLRPSKASIIDALFQHVKKTDVLIESHPYLLLHVLKFLKALWQGATQYVQILELFKTSDNFWKLLSSSISAVATTSTPLEDLSGVANLSLAYKYECHSVALDIIAHEMYLQEKLQQAEVSAKQSSEPSKERIENTVSKEKSGSASLTDLMDILSTWCKSPVLGNLIKLYATSGFHSKVFLHSKIASSLFIVHVMGKLTTGNSGSLSLSLTEKIRNMYKQLKEQSAFSELLAQYSVRGYSEGKELETLILSDLYYHLEGELEGRTMSPGPFKDLSQYLIESNLLQINEQMDRGDFYSASNCAFLYDLVLLQVDMGLEFWDHSEWKASKPIAERMLSYMQNANSMAFLANSKLSALKALTAMLCVYEENSTEVKRKHIDRGISEQLCESCINHICNDLQRTVKAIDLSSDVSEDILNFVSAQTELLLHLMRSLFRKLSPTVNRQMYVSICKLVSKTSGTVLRVLSDLRTSSTVVKGAMKLVLMLLLTSIKSSYSNSCVREKLDTGSIEAFTEVSLVSLGLLPILCNFIETVEYCTLTIATIDLMLNSFLTSDTWLPIIQKHLRLQFLVQKLQERDSFASIPIILKFLLTLAQVRGGAEMLQNANVFSSLKALFALLLDGNHILNIQGNNGFATSLDKDEKPQYIWGLGLAVVTAMINSLGDSSSCDDMMDGLISYFFCEQFHLVSYYLNAPDFSSDGHDKKRARTQKTQTSLAALKETEHTLMLICMLAKHRNWVKAMKEMDSQLRERCIHLLAFISKGAQRLGEHSSRTSPLMCPPILKEEVESNKKPSFLESRSGWFGLSLLGCATKTEVSDAVAIQIYKIAFLLLEFLCLQVEGAAKRAEEVGYIDLAHFPELPMPEILHGLQDQVVAIVTELCEAHKSKPIQPEIQGVCFLMLQIMEKALYLEFGVSQTCGIRPVLGRVEDFSRGIKLLMQAAETNSFLKTSIKDLKQIISLMYPGVVQAEGFL
uniref:Nucleoporin NUP188 homolog n=1 Tax=Nelumbo nucifera TaxID=4432 RepID=A0A822Z1N3_NELNU|nr:TPA_asm: hypothetical protein HUJ06_014647 [Nelumbo nucifera]